MIMPRTLEYTLCRSNENKPLVTLNSPLGNGQELNPDALRRLAQELRSIADLADAQDMGRAYRPKKGTTEF
jgi:hypothetical protein